ncbi:hypothetical protein EDC01DRAFT_630620 [Geopyxis carbonaria]|nr:hypothetical protein EDC01DRAFT_630620 [Geopyxis carbonaria]
MDFDPNMWEKATQGSGGTVTEGQGLEYPSPLTAHSEVSSSHTVPIIDDGMPEVLHRTQQDQIRRLEHRCDITATQLNHRFHGINREIRALQHDIRNLHATLEGRCQCRDNKQRFTLKPGSIDNWHGVGSAEQALSWINLAERQCWLRAAQMCIEGTEEQWGSHLLAYMRGSAALWASAIFTSPTRTISWSEFQRMFVYQYVTMNPMLK